MNTMSRKLTALLAGLVLAMSFAGPAFGQSTLEAYSDEGGVIESQGENGAQSPAGGGGDGGGAAGDDGSSLPFTGLDLALIAGSGLLLVGAGVGMRVLTRGPQTDPRSI
jgi:hypothetical protein